MVPRINLQSLGRFVAQFFDKKDLATGAEFDETAPQRNQAGLYGYQKNEIGIPVLRVVLDADGNQTNGPMGGWMCWPGKAPRKLAQWAQVFPAKVTTASPLKVTPVSTGSATDWPVATDLKEIAAFSAPGQQAPAVGAFGLVIVGTDLFGQAPLFFQGGGAGSTLYRVAFNYADGSYNIIPISYPGGPDTGSGITGYELQVSLSVPINQFVEGTVRGDGKTWFSMPFGC